VHPAANFRGYPGKARANEGFRAGRRGINGTNPVAAGSSASPITQMMRMTGRARGYTARNRQANNGWPEAA
jgi:hypothetical protein